MKTNSPTHAEISHHAHELWLSRGSPIGQDEKIWLEAERELAKPGAAAKTPSATDGRGNGNSQISQGSADPKPADLQRPMTAASGRGSKSTESDRLKGEMASESTVEYLISPAVSDDEAIKAALQKREARAPQVPTKIAPPQKPVESGKPLWDKPHSS